ncbi:Dimethylglycine dehydrogenase, mitochondrial [Nymphon striatum]|nr:Dimethylglycine dehydrogenase, mitochondrial [Nymphon striatum]
MRMEKGYLHWKADLIYERNPMETGLDFFVKMDKPDFIGKKALEAQLEKGLQKKLVTLSGAYGHRVNKNIAYAFVEPELSAINTELKVEILGKKYPAVITEACLYDPKNERYDLKCDSARKGWLRAAHSHSAIPELEKVAKNWAEFGLDIETVEGDQLHKLTGIKAYSYANHVKSGGSVHPLSFTRELARVALEQGAKIFSNSKVSKTVIPLISIQAATRELTDEEYSQVLPEGHTIADSRRVVFYGRKDNRNRILLGSLGASELCVGTDKDRMHKAFKTVFPQFKPKDLEFYWGGRIAHTKDYLPHLHEPAPGILAGLGYNGRGMAMSTVMGRILAERVLGKEQQDLAMPTTPYKSFALHRFHEVGVSVTTKYYEMRDALDVKLS